MRKASNFILPVLGGLILPLSFAPYKFSIIAWFAFVPLLFSLENGRFPFWKGFLMGFSFFAVLMWWIPFSNVESNVIPQMVAGYILLLGLLSSYFGLSAMIYSRFDARKSILVFPVIFTGLEFIRGLSSVLGFPWGSLGYSQTNLIYFVQFASVGGLPLVTFWVLLLNVTVYKIINSYIIERDMRKRYLYMLAGLILFPVLFSGTVILRGYRSVDNIRATIIQPNIKPDTKRLQSGFRLEKIKSMIFKAPQSDIYILPETASPFSIRHKGKTQELFRELAYRKNAYIVVGTPDMEIKGDRVLHYNASALVDSSGICDYYRKMFLVPFVERLPYDDVFPILRNINLGQGHFSPGESYTVFDLKNTRFPVYICYEAIFPQLIRKFIQKGAGFLVNITEDGWFGKTSAPYQHAQMAIFRCIENRRALLRAANTGISLIVDPFGRIIKRTDIYTEDTINGSIPVVKGNTVYTRLGDTFGWLFIITALFFMYKRYFIND